MEHYLLSIIRRNKFFSETTNNKREAFRKYDIIVIDT